MASWSECFASDAEIVALAFSSLGSSFVATGRGVGVLVVPQQIGKVRVM